MTWRLDFIEKILPNFDVLLLLSQGLFLQSLWSPHLFRILKLAISFCTLHRLALPLLLLCINMSRYFHKFVVSSTKKPNDQYCQSRSNLLQVIITFLWLLLQVKFSHCTVASNHHMYTVILITNRENSTKYIIVHISMFEIVINVVVIVKLVPSLFLSPHMHFLLYK